MKKHLEQPWVVYNGDRNEPTFLGSGSVRFDWCFETLVQVRVGSVRFIFEKDSSIQEIMLQIGWIFILQLLILIYLITLRLETFFKALEGLILVFSLTFFRLNLIGIRNEPKM
jgi:hypothetical protein